MPTAPSCSLLLPGTRRPRSTESHGAPSTAAPTCPAPGLVPGQGSRLLRIQAGTSPSSPRHGTAHSPWAQMCQRMALRIRMLSAPNSFSIATMDSPSGGTCHLCPETPPSLPAKAARQHTKSGKGCQDPALTTKQQHGAAQPPLAMGRSPAPAPERGWALAPCLLACPLEAA